MEHNKVNVCVTGGTGFFGHNLIRALLKDPRIDRIHVFCRNAPPTEEKLSDIAPMPCSTVHMGENGEHVPCPDPVGYSFPGGREPVNRNSAVPRSSHRNAIFDSDRITLFYGQIDSKIKSNPSLEESMKNCSIVFHACGDTRWWNAINQEQRATNVNGTLSAMHAAATVKSVTRFIYTSTVDVLGHQSGGRDAVLGDYHGAMDKDEYSFKGFGYNYGDTKREADRCCVEYATYYKSQFTTGIVRAAAMIGPWDVTNKYGRLFKELKNSAVIGIPAGGTSVCHVEDVVQLHITMAFAPTSCIERHPIVNAAGHNVTYKQLFHDMRAMLDNHKNMPKYIGGCCGYEVIPQFALVIYGAVCDAYSTSISNKEPEINAGMARYMSCHAYYSCTLAQEVYNYPTNLEQRYYEAIFDSYNWYRVRARF